MSAVNDFGYSPYSWASPETRTLKEGKITLISVLSYNMTCMLSRGQKHSFQPFTLCLAVSIDVQILANNTSLRFNSLVLIIFVNYSFYFIRFILLFYFIILILFFLCICTLEIDLFEIIAYYHINYTTRNSLLLVLPDIPLNSPLIAHARFNILQHFTSQVLWR